MPIFIPILLVAAVAGYFIYQSQQKPASTTASTQAGAFMQNMFQDFRAHSPSVEDQVHGYGGYVGQAGQSSFRPELVHSVSTHIPHIEDQVAAAAAMYPSLGMHPSEQLNPAWMQIQQTQMPTSAQADLLKQVRLKNVRGFYRTNILTQIFGLYVGDPRDMRSYVWYVGPNVGRTLKAVPA